MQKAPVLEKPVAVRYKIIQEFGFNNTGHIRRHDFYNHFDKKHPGIDFELPVGTVIKAAFKGRVMRKEFHPGMGLVIGIRNQNIVALYGHLSKFRVNWYQEVKRGEVIGLSGDSGMLGSAPHLHFELRDITKPNLKSMVFKPKFGEPIIFWKKLGWLETFKLMALQILDHCRSMAKLRIRG